MKRWYLSYLTALLFFGSNGVIASTIGLSSYEIVFLRSLLGGVLLWAIFFLTRQKLTIRKHKKDVWYLALSGFFMAASWLFVFEAYAQIGVSLGMLINYCGPAIVVALSPLVFRERITWQKAAALGSALLGAVFISGEAIGGGVRLWGLICAVLSAFSYAAMVIYNKKASGISGLENAVLQLSFTAAAVAVFVWCRQGFQMEIAAADWAPILWLGFVNTGICCYLYFSAIGRLPVQSVAICGYLEPLSAVLLAVLLLHETMGPLQILGACLILGGAVFGECSPFSARSAARKPNK